MALFNTSIKYEVVVGLIPGYHGISNNAELAIVRNAWMKYALKYYNETNVYISSIAYEAKALYNREWGCPIDGEPVVVFHCTLNPEFVKNEKVYEDGIVYVAKKLKEELRQSTVTITKTNASIAYLSDKME